jgi:hypothetical protein
MHCKENPIYVFLFWELRGLSPNFHIHVSMSDLYIPGLVDIFPCSRIGRLILEIYKSLTDIWVQELGDRTLYFCFGNNSFISGNTLMGPDIYNGFSPALHLQCGMQESNTGIVHLQSESTQRWLLQSFYQYVKNLRSFDLRLTFGRSLLCSLILISQCAKYYSSEESYLSFIGHHQRYTK